MQLQLYRSEITIKIVCCSYCQQYILPLPAVTTVNSTVELQWVRYSLGKNFISSTKLFVLPTLNIFFILK